MSLDAVQVVAIARARMLATTGAGKRKRKAAGVSLAHVAGALDIGVTTLWRWEAGQRRPSGPAAAAWAQLLDELEAASSPRGRKSPK